eukprot:gene26510-34714_t
MHVIPLFFARWLKYWAAVDSPYALALFGVSLPIYVWAGSFAPNSVWMAASFAVFAINWGAFYAVRAGSRADERNRFLTILADDSERLERLVQRLLELARADMSAPGAERCALTATLTTVVERFRERGLSIAVDLQRDADIAMAADTLDAVRNREIPVMPFDASGSTLTMRSVPGPAGAPDIGLHIYLPDGAARPLPCIYHIHGGGYVAGKAATGEPRHRPLVKALGCALVSVDYRLAPETPHPGPVEDCYAGLAWLVANAAPPTSYPLDSQPHRLAHLPGVYLQAHKAHHFLHDATAFDAHIYGSGAPEEFFTLAFEVLTGCLLGFCPPSLTYNVLNASWANKQVHTRAEKDAGGWNGHVDHHTTHDKNLGPSLPFSLLDMYFNTAVHNQQDVWEGKWKIEKTTSSDK